VLNLQNSSHTPFKSPDGIPPDESADSPINLLGKTSIDRKWRTPAVGAVLEAASALVAIVDGVVDVGAAAAVVRKKRRNGNR
jgi:hypothetical protein